MAAPPELPESFPRAILAKQPPPIGRTVQRLREARGLSQERLGKLVGLRRTYLSRVENGHVMPGPGTVVPIARALGVDLRELLLPQPERGSNGAVLREPTCARLVTMFSELQPQEMTGIISEARQMRAARFKPPQLRSSARLCRSAGRFRGVGGRRRLR